MKFDMDVVGRRIKSGIVDSGMDYESFAEKVGVSTDTVRSWVTGRTGISLANAVAVADALDWPLDRVAVRERDYTAA